MSARPLALAVGAILYGAAALTANAEGGGLPEPVRAELAATAAEVMPKLVVHEAPRPAPEAGFTGPEGETSLADFRGRIVVLNLWATWCAPCREEMPAIERLAGMTADEDISVIALSSDRGGARRVEDFYAEIGVEDLPIYTDPAGKLPREAAVMGLPVTLIIDRTGQEIARLTGAEEWDSPEIVALLRRIAEATASETEGRS